MTACSELQQTLLSGPEGVSAGVHSMYLDPDFQRIAKWNHKNCSLVRGLLNWEDFHRESIIRFVDQVHKGKHIRSCQLYYFSICRNYCLELVRSSKKTEVPREESRTDQRMEDIRPYVAKLQERCRILLEALYYYSPPFSPRNRQGLSDLLLEHGYEVQPSSIPSTISYCKRKLRDIIRANREDFFD